MHEQHGMVEDATGLTVSILSGALRLSYPIFNSLKSNCYLLIECILIEWVGRTPLLGVSDGSRITAVKESFHRLPCFLTPVGGGELAARGAQPPQLDSCPPTIEPASTTPWTLPCPGW